MMFDLCLVTNPDCVSTKNYLNFIEKAILGGVTCIQFRDKTSPASLKYEFARALKSLLSTHGIPLIINDDIDLALSLDAEGVHLGQTDRSPQDARKILGLTKYIGLSIETYQQLQIANDLDCIDYVAASAVFQSTTKRDCQTIWGLEGLKNISDNSRYPVIAIGGITVENVHFVIKHGAHGVAVVGALHHATDPTHVAQQFMYAINQEKQYV